MGKEIITFADNEIEQKKFYHRKNLVLLEDEDTDKYRYLTWFLPVKNYKYFIGYKDDDHEIKPLCIKLPKTCACIKSCDGETK